MPNDTEIMGGKLFADGVELKVRHKIHGTTNVVSLHIDDLMKLIKLRDEDDEISQESQKTESAASW